MTERRLLIQQLISAVGDYKSGKISPFDEAHVNKWLNQFPTESQMQILSELYYVLSRTYLKKTDISNFFKDAIITPNLLSGIFSNTSLLNIQGGGNSQKDCIDMFNDELYAVTQNKAGVNICDAEHHLYLDDVIFSGQRMRTDITNWLVGPAPQECRLYIVTHTMHRLSLWYSESFIKKKITESGKQISVKFIYRDLVEDRLYYTYSSDVLRPVTSDWNESIKKYINSLTKPPLYRQPGSIGDNAFFSSDNGRQLLENEFLAAGSYIREICKYFSVNHRPLGYMKLESLGFGTMIVSYRNCPNNAPLALWAGDPWYPLFPRSNNTTSATRWNAQGRLDEA